MWVCTHCWIRVLCPLCACGDQVTAVESQVSPPAPLSQGISVSGMLFQANWLTNIQRFSSLQPPISCRCSEMTDVCHHIGSWHGFQWSNSGCRLAEQMLSLTGLSHTPTYFCLSGGWPYYTSQAVLELMVILLLLFPKSWDYRWEPLCPAWFSPLVLWNSRHGDSEHILSSLHRAFYVLWSGYKW